MVGGVRNSETAMLVTRGVRRLLRQSGLVSVMEMGLPSGLRADVVGLAPDGSIAIIEVKSSLTDFQADHKWSFYRQHCDRLYFAFPEQLDHSIFPPDAGLIAADSYGAAFLREAPLHQLPGAARRSMILRFARAAAHRLHVIQDPMAGAELNT